MTCEDNRGQLPAGSDLYTTCIPMSNFVFSFVTAIFTVGGLVGSLIANMLLDSYGRKGASRTTALLVAIGAGFMSVSGSIATLSFGR